MKLVANSVTQTTIWLPFLFIPSKSYSHEHKGSKSKFAIFFTAKPEKSKIRQIKFPQKFPVIWFIVNGLIFRAI